MDFSKLAVTEKTTGNSIPAQVTIAGNKVTVSFDFETDKARLTSTGKEYFINVSGKTNVKVNNRDCATRFQGNLFIK